MMVFEDFATEAATRPSASVAHTMSVCQVQSGLIFVNSVSVTIIWVYSGFPDSSELKFLNSNAVLGGSGGLGKWVNMGDKWSYYMGYRGY